MSSFAVLRDPSAIARLRAEIDTITHRPEAERMALLKLRYGNEIAKAAVEIGRAIGWREPAKVDWRNLFACKLITRDGPKGYITLTALGLMWQQRIALALTRFCELHFLLSPSEERFWVNVRCTCGWSVSLSKNERSNLITGQFFAYATHKDAVAKGLWKKPRSVEEIVGEAMAKRAASLVPAMASGEKVDA